MSKRRLTVLGATGSIGASTLDVVGRHPDRFEVVALTGHRRLDVLIEQCQHHRPRYAVVANDVDRRYVTEQLSGNNTEVLAGAQALEDVSAMPEVDTVMAAIVGAAGLPPTLAAVRAGKRVLLANKEALVMAGSLFIGEVRRCQATLLPIDSEHNAVFQSLPDRFVGNLGGMGVSRILLTASGGPFRVTPMEQLASVTPDQACAHPNWSMGRKISVDSATMMNKGLEVIEARWLFEVEPSESRWSSIRKASSTRSCSTWMAPCSLSLATRICARRLRTPWPIRNALMPAYHRLTCLPLPISISNDRRYSVFLVWLWLIRLWNRVAMRLPY